MPCFLYIPASFAACVVHLYYYEEMRVDEIAAALGIRPDAVKMRLSRARAELRRRLNGKGEK